MLVLIGLILLVGGLAESTLNPQPVRAATSCVSPPDYFACYLSGYNRYGWMVVNSSNTPLDLAVGGLSSATTGDVYGVHGQSNSSSGTGVRGEAAALSGSTYGVYGRAGSPSGVGVYGIAPTTGIRGEATGTEAAYGIYGRSSSPKGYGVFGLNYSYSGTTFGVYGESGSPQGYGVYGSNGNRSGPAYGVFGGSASSAGYGIYGLNYSSSGTTYGVYGSTLSPSGTGVIGMANASSGGIGIYGIASTNNPDYAGYFWGNVRVTGTIVSGSGGGLTQVDDPLDPANKYLYHATVGSSDLKNIYDGVVTLDKNGEAIVDMPAWFESFNKDFRYQLTAIGKPGPGLYIAEEIKGNRFKIAGGQPGTKVSWQVTGIRNDPYAQQHPMSVEADKPTQDHGSYLHPEEYGQPETKGIGYEQIRKLRSQEVPSPPSDATTTPQSPIQMSPTPTQILPPPTQTPTPTQTP
jgi:hypothetical protein